MPCPIRTSTYRNFETISSGFGRLFAIRGPPFPKHNGGPVQWGRLSPGHIIERFKRLCKDDRRSYYVSVRFAHSDGAKECLIVSTIESGHLEALYGGQEGSEETVLVG